LCSDGRPALLRAPVHRAAAAAGTPEEASARRWLHRHGRAVKCVRVLVLGAERREDAPGRDLDATRLSSLLAGLPALASLGCLHLRADLRSRPTAAAVRAFLAGAARAIARCARLQTLLLHITLRGGLAGQVPKALVRRLASARSLEEVTLCFDARHEADRLKWPATPSVACLVADLAGLPRLRALGLDVMNVRTEATLPASVSRLAQLTSLSLIGFRGLRCAPGWARLPALVCLELGECAFAGAGEAALPGMDALVSLTALNVWFCPSLRVLPTSLWRLTRLHVLAVWGEPRRRGGLPRAELPVAGVPAARAPCFDSLVSLTLAGHNLRAFPPGILGMTRLGILDLTCSCFERLPEGVSVLTRLGELHLGRHPLQWLAIGGALDARALGSLAGFPWLTSLVFTNCCVEFAPGIRDAADHPRLEVLQLRTAYPAAGPSSRAFLAFVRGLLQQGRNRALRLRGCAVQGAGRRDGDGFLAALQGVGWSLRDARRDDDDDYTQPVGGPG